MWLVHITENSVISLFIIESEQNSTMNLSQLFTEIGVERQAFKDLHVTRMFSAFVVVSEGKVIKVTEPSMTHCPLARMFYPEFHGSPHAQEKAREFIAKAMEDKIEHFGFFTEFRELIREKIEVPYGASEMLMYAMKKGIIDAAVVVCDGAGTVITDRAEVVQGIGARMNGLFYTSPIPVVMDGLRTLKSHVVFEDARIGQVEGVREAARRGYRSIAVTVNSFMDEHPADLKMIASEYGVRVCSFMVCATGVSVERLREIEQDADVVWSCGSPELRRMVGTKAILQITTKIPVYVMTRRGLEIVAGYAYDEEVIRSLDPAVQHLIAGNRRGTKITMGTFQTYLSEAELPVRDTDEPR